MASTKIMVIKLQYAIWIIYGPKREDVVGGWRKLHTEDLHNLYFSPIIGVIKSRTG
jgi:hypothetical protein